jgi:hypothetical protein
MKYLLVLVFVVGSLAKDLSHDNNLRLLLEDEGKEGSSIRGDSAGKIHHVARRTTLESLTAPNSTVGGTNSSHGATNSSDRGDALKQVVDVPAATLNMVREVAVPVVNTTLAVPVTVLLGIARLSVSNVTHNGTGHHFHFGHHSGHGHNMSHHHHHLHHLGAFNMSSIRLPFNISAIYLPINMTHPNLNFTSIALNTFNYTAMSHHFAPVTTMLRGLHNVSISEQLHPSNITKHLDNLRNYLAPSPSSEAVNQTISSSPSNHTVKN